MMGNTNVSVNRKRCDYINDSRTANVIKYLPHWATAESLNHVCLVLLLCVAAEIRTSLISYIERVWCAHELDVCLLFN